MLLPMRISARPGHFLPGPGPDPGWWAQKAGLLHNFKAANRLMKEALASRNKSEPTRKRMFSTGDYESTMDSRKLLFFTRWPPPN